jgi:hypothetical protein
MLRYQVIGPPIAGRHAFAPLPAATMEGVSGGSSVVFGAPGTLPVPAPHPSLTVDPARAHQHSSIAPDMIAPSIYVARMMHDFSPWRLGGGRHSGNGSMMPIPAAGLGYVALPAQRAARTPSRAGVTATPRAVLRWKIFGGHGRTVT